jgi:DNA replication and repair protein RecF
VRSAIDHILLTDFRSYARAELSVHGQSVFLFGPNGAGKTNLLEAISLLSPGRGLRGAALAELGGRSPGEPVGRAWAVSALVTGDDGAVRIGTGVETADAARRLVRVDAASVPPGRLTEHLRPLWLTPTQDRLFLDGAAERRRFFDRLVFAAEPAHAAHVGDYERAMRERTRLLAEETTDVAWLAALEARLARAGALIADARARSLDALRAEIATRGEGIFPRADLTLLGSWEQAAGAGAGADELEANLAAALAAARPRDQAAGRPLVGPHRGDLLVTHHAKGRPAAECSTGEQKALILNLVLAQAARLSRANSQPNPILLLDEVAAHLDSQRRAALFDEIEALSLQAFLTGTDEALFETLKGRALGVHVDTSSLTALET